MEEPEILPATGVSDMLRAVPGVHRLSRTAFVLAVSGLLLLTAPVSAHPDATDAEVSVGSPHDVVTTSHQNEPAVAIDAHDPNVLVAGSNDYIDQQVCPEALVTQTATCDDFRAGIGVSGVYFSFDRGNSWMQPTYTGWQARDCGSATPCDGSFGPIGRIPWYYEAGLTDDGDPAVAIGPRPVNGHFSWANGSRVYYANLAANFPGHRAIPRGYEAVAVSRLDNPTLSRVQDKANWARPVVVTAQQSNTAFTDKEQIWADNAASSSFFGRAYICFAEFRSNGHHNPGTEIAPLTVSYSSDGGDTWTTKQIQPADAGGHGQGGYGSSGCTVRTDSDGVVYVFAEQFQNPLQSGLPTHGTHVMFKSFDGGAHWTKARKIATVTDPCFFLDPLSGRCVMDGYTGARTDLAAAPSVDIANGAPTGDDATNLIVDTWADATGGLNHEDAKLMWSSNGGKEWSAPASVSLGSDRPIYAAPAISPSGDRVYVVYEAVTSPWRGDDVDSPRPYHGVFRSAPIGNGGPGAWATEYNGPFGDLRSSFPGHRLREERIGDYVYAAASRDYGVGLWIDARNAEVCPAVQDWRAASLTAGSIVIPAPWPTEDCPTFGNMDVWSATTG
jgi:hypothetical protein